MADKVSATVSKLGGFVTHYGNELLAVAGTIQALLGVVPLQHEDRDRISETLDALKQGAERAIAGAAAIEGDISERVVIRKSDVEEALAAYLNTAAGKASIAAAMKGTKNAGNS